MPLQISEIGVHIAIGDAAGPAAQSLPGTPDAAPAMTEERVEALVRACVRDVLHTLRLREER